MAGAELGAALRHVHQIFSAGSVAGLSDAELLERFAAVRDQAAFAALVARHGPMVLAVCRGVLKDGHDAEDAFQATFLVLVRKAGSLWLVGSLASWLYRVAYRVALQANKAAARRRTRERQGVEMDIAGRAGGGPWAELRPALHEEVARLPGKYRAAVVLCYFEGLTREQAADQLRLPAGTVGSRLARGRDILRDRLRRRGLTLTSSGLGAAIARESRAAVPDAWVGATIEAAARAGAGRAAAVALTEEVLRTMAQTKLKLAAFALIGAGALAVAAGAALVERNVPGTTPAATATRVAEAPDPAPDDDKTGTIEIRGRVVDPAGKPFSGAEIYLPRAAVNGQGIPSVTPNRVATSDADGRFRFAFDKAANAPGNGKGLAWRWASIAAAAPGFGPAWVEVGSLTGGGEATIQLVRDDVPIRGRLLDLQGRPVAGAAVRMTRVVGFKDGVDLDAMLGSGVYDDLSGAAAWNRDPAWLRTGPTWTTDADGRFEIKGVGRDRVIALEVASPVLEKAVVYAMTRPSKGTPMPRPRQTRPRGGMQMMGRGPAPRLVGATFDQVAGPTKPITGVVRRKGTNEPVAGVLVTGAEPATWTEVQATTDAEGRFRLVGLPKAESYIVSVQPVGGNPYLGTRITVTDTEGLKPIERTLELPRGVVVKGRLIDKATGKVVPPQQVIHVKLPSNTNPGNFQGDMRDWPPDGSFVITVPPGEGFFTAAARDSGALYARARLAKADKGRGVGGTGDKETITTMLDAMNAYKIVDVPADAREFAIDLELTRAASHKGKVVDAEGKPIVGTEAYGLIATWGKITKLEGDSFEITGLEPGHPRSLSITHKGRKLAGSVVVGDAEMKSDEPVVVRLVPIGSIKGRLVDDDGMPLSGASVRIAYYELDGINLPSGRGGVWPTNETVTTDADGRFEFAGIIPGLDTNLWIEVKSRPRERFTSDRLSKQFTPESNATIDFGDVKVKAEPN
jgi:RNA polymerase sigma factor (sigma-70 family)